MSERNNVLHTLLSKGGNLQKAAADDGRRRGGGAGGVGPRPSATVDDELVLDSSSPWIELSEALLDVDWQEEEEGTEKGGNLKKQKQRQQRLLHGVVSFACRGVNLSGGDGQKLAVWQRLVSAMASSPSGPNCSKLRHLELADCNVNASSSRTVFLFLQKLAGDSSGGNKNEEHVPSPPLSLTSLDASLNPIGPRGARAVASLLQAMTQQQQKRQQEKGGQHGGHVEGVSGKKKKRKKKKKKGQQEGYRALEELNLCHTQLGHYGAQALSAYLPPSLVRLDLSHNNLQHDGAWKLADGAFARLTNLRHLNLSNNELGNDGLSQVIAHPDFLIHLESLNVAGNGITWMGMESLCARLTELAQLEQCVSIGKNDDSRSSSFAEGGSSGGDDDTSEEDSILREFAYAAVSVNPKSAANRSGDGDGNGEEPSPDSAGGALSGPALRELNLSDNPIGDQGATHLSRALQTARYVQCVNASKCNIGDDGAAALAKALHYEEDESDSDSDDDESIDEADPGGAGTGKGKVGGDAGGLAKLDLSDNPLGDLGVGAFCEHLDSTTLTHLNLKGCAQVSESRRRILDMLLKHKQQQEQQEHSSSSRAAAALLDVSTSSKHALLNLTVGDDGEEKKDGGGGDISTCSPTAGEHNDEDEGDDHLIEEGREAVASLLEHDDEHDEAEETMNGVSLSPRYLELLTNRWDTDRILRYGAYGALYGTRDDGLLPEEDLPLVVRRVELSRTKHPAMQAIRDQVVKQALELRHDGFLPVVASIATSTARVFVYNLAASSSHQHTATAKTLRAILASPDDRRKLTWRKRFDLMRQVAVALEYLHSGEAIGAPCVHGDLQPGNMYISGDDFSTVRLSDALISRIVGTDRPRFATGEVVFGSRSYRCPRYERGSTPYDAYSEMFSFGIILVEVLTGCLQRSSVPKSKSSRDAYYDFVLQRQPLPLDTLAGGRKLTRDALQVLTPLWSSLLSAERDHRPSAMTVTQALEQVLSEMK